MSKIETGVIIEHYSLENISAIFLQLLGIEGNTE